VEILYMATSGASDPTRASIPWHLAANGSAEAGQSARLLLLGDSTELVKGDVREGLQGVGLPPLRELVAKALERSIPVHV
jgi:predicted peroxiredoxin